MSQQMSCSVPDALHKKVDDAAEERELLMSEVIRAGLRYYVDENPDDIEAFST